ncbi:MAG TPA: hypothetical protein VF859_01385 [Burkholderiales bacterium]
MSGGGRYSIRASLALTHEDRLRLHVLLKNVQAIRIDERTLTVHGLSERGEAAVKLNPDVKPELYLKRVREFISAHVTGSPGGYPVYLARWTRMGQAPADSLANLLMLGEPEAIVAAACAPGLTDELARRLWWVEPSSEHARRMLERECIVGGSMGRVLAAHLVEHLPFEAEPRLRYETVRLVLQGNLLEDAARLALWQRSARENAYRVAFLFAAADRLPAMEPARSDFPAIEPALDVLAAQGNALALVLLRALGAPGQTFAAVAAEALGRLTDRDVSAAAFAAVGNHFRKAGADMPALELEGCRRAADAGLADPAGEGATVLHVLPQLRDEVFAVLYLGRVGETTIVDFLAHTTASGTVLRKQIQPFAQPVIRHLLRLRQSPTSAAP